MLQDLFLFDFHAGTDERGRHRGTLRGTGLRPCSSTAWLTGGSTYRRESSAAGLREDERGELVASSAAWARSSRRCSFSP